MWDKVLEDSSMVEEVFQRGEVAHARKHLLRQGRLKLGLPDAATVAAIESISRLDRLDMLGERMLTVNSWNELLSP